MAAISRFVLQAQKSPERYAFEAWKSVLWLIEVYRPASGTAGMAVSELWSALREIISVMR